MRAGEETPLGILRNGDDEIFGRLAGTVAARIGRWLPFGRLPRLSDAPGDDPAAFDESEAIAFFAIFVDHRACQRVTIDVYDHRAMFEDDFAHDRHGAFAADRGSAVPG